MQISDKGLKALIAEEGEVLRAYKCPAGIWTIGVGLTKASGVIDPKPGMTITKQESGKLLRLALARVYEPEVEKAMSIIKGGKVTRPLQPEFDAGVSFHFNTGAISTATWVKLWKADAARSKVLAAFKAWNKSEGKVLPALVARRDREAAMLTSGVYLAIQPAASRADLAQWALALTAEERVTVLRSLQKLGYVGELATDISRQEVKDFQRDHGLTVDGILGRASLSTLQRVLDAKSKALAPTTAVTASAAAVVTGAVDILAAIPPQADTAALIGAGIWLLSHLWSYRTEIFGWLKPAPTSGA